MRALKMLMKDSPLLIPCTFVMAAFEAAFPYIGILLSAEIITQLTLPDRDMNYVFFLAIVMAAANCFTGLLLSFLYQFQDVLKYRQMKIIDGKVAEKSWQLDYETVCDPKVHEKANIIPHWGYEHGVLAVVQQLSQILSGLFTVCISAVLVIEFFSLKATGTDKLSLALNHWLSPAVFLGLFGLTAYHTIWAAAKTQKVRYQTDNDIQQPFNQVIAIFESCCKGYQRGKDLRMFRAQPMVRRHLLALFDKLETLQTKAQKYTKKMTLMSLTSARVFNLLTYIFVGLKALCGAFGAGSLLKYTGMVEQMSYGVERLCNAVRDVWQNIHYIDDYFAYQDLENRTASGTKLVTEAILNDYVFEFRNVTFTYPGVETPSLSNVSCVLKKGEKVAIVGRNGSGKTTFIKLLCRLYDPQEGAILLNGTDIREYQYEEYLKFFSTVFQDFCIFALQLGENVAAESTYDEAAVERALENAGFGDRLKTLPDGLHTQLYKYFYDDGVELSGGEGQKVAIARCLSKDAPYAILDEPTAALDPVAEADIYQRMNQFIEGKGAIYISHRL
ncbi:MAG: ABC transporter ATP-binding protein/permease, partial [Lachnospiraceae bacterium]|nr:ABC transporter ATP-binding protein/permease [Lachnospiraceae bacterium]